MKALVVGGWVRDKLLREAGYDVKSSDRDWVVVGATPQELLSLGFLPVGVRFVFGQFFFILKPKRNTLLQEPSGKVVMAIKVLPFIPPQMSVLSLILSDAI